MIIDCKIPNDIEDYFMKHLSEGIFFRKRIGFWRGEPNYFFGENQKMSFIPSRVRSRHDIEINRIKFLTKRLIFFNTFKTKFGYFVPKQNIERFWTTIDELRASHSKLCDDICNDYDEILKELKRRLIEVAYFKWTNDLGYPGVPTDSFIDKFVSDGLKYNGIKSIKRRFSFDVLPVNPILNESNTSYGSVERIKKINYYIFYSFYMALVIKRMSLIKSLNKNKLKIIDGKLAYKSIVCFCQGYKNTIFYDDNNLINLIDDLRIYSMNSISRNPDEVVKKIDHIIENVVKNERYSLGMVYEKK